MYTIRNASERAASFAFVSLCVAMGGRGRKMTRRAEPATPRERRLVRSEATRGCVLRVKRTPRVSIAHKLSLDSCW